VLIVLDYLEINAMTLTREDLKDFAIFADGQLAGKRIESLQELVSQWEVIRRRKEVDSAIRQRLAEADAGTGLHLDEFMDEFRNKNNVKTDA